MEEVKEENESIADGDLSGLEVLMLSDEEQKSVELDLDLDDLPSILEID
jgi:hypothetical protein